jgi:hypothetical protein
MATRREREIKRQRIDPRNDKTDRACTCSLHLHLCIESHTSSQSPFPLLPLQTYQRHNLTRPGIRIKQLLSNLTRNRHDTHPRLNMCTLPRRDMSMPHGCRRLLLFASARPLDTDRLREIRKISVALPACITRSAQFHQLNESIHLQDIIHRMPEHMLRLVKVLWLHTHHTARTLTAYAIHLLSSGKNRYVFRNTGNLARL